MFDYRLAKRLQEEQLREAELRYEARRARDSAGVRARSRKLIVAGLVVAIAVTTSVILWPSV